MKNLKHTNNILHLACGILLLITLSACGGGSSGGAGGVGGGANPDLLKAQTEFGVAPQDVYVDGREGGGGDGGDGGGGAGGSAGDGAPIKRATVIALDRNGIRLSGQTDDNGNFLVLTSASNPTLTAPIVVKVIDSGGKVLTSVITTNITRGQFPRVMVNPLTDKIVSDSLATLIAGTDKILDGTGIDTSKVPVAILNLRTSIQVALSYAGVTATATFNPITDKYVYNGTGVDAIIESITHTRNPADGATQLRAKFGPATFDTNGVIQPTFVTSVTPLGTTQVNLSTSAELTYEKLNDFVNALNYCLKATTASNDPNCDDDASPATEKLFFTANYKHSGKDWDEDFINLCSNSDRSCIKGSTVRNPVILYVGNYPGSTATFNDVAVVEVIIRQPGTGILVGTSTTAIEYTKIVVFKRDESQTRSKARNWILHGNQRFFDWSVQSIYFTSLQQNSATTAPSSLSRTSSGVRLGFSVSRFDYANRNNSLLRGYVSSDVFAVRLTGPGLPASGIVYAPTTSNTSTFAQLNKTGVIPAPGTTTNRSNADFRVGGVYYPSGAAFAPADWPGNPTGSNITSWSDSPVTDFGILKANNRYTAEFFTNAAPLVPIVETVLNLAQIENPAAYVQRPLHSLMPSVALVTPPQSTSGTSITAQWIRNIEAVKIETAYACSTSAAFANTCYSANVLDRFYLQPNSASQSITLGSPFPALSNVTNTGREIGIIGNSARARFQQSVVYSN